MTYKCPNTAQSEPIVVNGYATAYMSRELLAYWASDLTYVSYYSYGFNAEGDLIPLDDEELIRYAYISRVAPFFVLSPIDESGTYNYDLTKAVFTNPHIRDRLINNILLTVLENNYSGMVFNFGYIAPEDKEQFVVTVSKTAVRLNRKAAIVIVSLTTGVYDEGIDYLSLNRASNFLELRTFHFDHGNVPPGALSPVSMINQFFETNKVLDARKILLGITNYGYDWTLPHSTSSSPAKLISNLEAESKAMQSKAPVHYDNEAQAPFFEYTDSSKTNHIIWYENKESIQAKLQLVNEFGLAGISIWTIMDPFPAAIKAINETAVVKKVVP